MRFDNHHSGIEEFRNWPAAVGGLRSEATGKKDLRIFIPVLPAKQIDYIVLELNLGRRLTWGD